MRRFAEDTSVPVAKSRGEIDRLLREWGARAVQWSDDWQHDTSVLRFVWRFDGLDYLARFTLQLPGPEELEKHAIDGRTGRVSERKLGVLLGARGKREHRLLLLWLRAALNAVDAGLVTAEALFLPFLEGRDGQTVAEVALPRLAELTAGSAIKLLG